MTISSGSGSAAWPALGFALTGEWLPGPEDDAAPTAESVAAWLSSLGWTGAAVAAHRHELQQQELPWPHPVAPEQRGGLGAAQFHALLADLRRLLSVDGLTDTRRSGPSVIGPAEQRLLADRPPHHLG